MAAAKFPIYYRHKKLDIEAYKSSGIIESYVLDLTSQEESRELEALAAQHPAIREEIAAVRAALETYAEQFAQPPPPSLKSKVMAALDQADEITHTQVPVPPFISVAKNVDGNEERTAGSQSNVRGESSSNRFLYWSIAASILLVISALANLILYNNLKATQTLLAQANTEQLRLAQEKQTLQDQFGSVMMTVSVVSNPEYKVVNLMPLEAGMEAAAVVYWNRQIGNLYIASNKLPTPPKGKSYQLWAIVDGKPVDAGIFEPKRADGLLAMKEMPVNAQAFAITLEDAQGSTAPTGKMYVMGKV